MNKQDWGTANSVGERLPSMHKTLCLIPAAGRERVSTDTSALLQEFSQIKQTCEQHGDEV